MSYTHAPLLIKETVYHVGYTVPSPRGSVLLWA